MMKKSCKGSDCLAYLENKIDEIDPHQDTTRSGKFNRAIEKAKSLTDAEWTTFSHQLKQVKSSLPANIVAPSAIQVKIDPKLEVELAEVEASLKKALGLVKLQTRYEIEILWLIYLKSLQENAIKVGDSNRPNDLTGPDMIKKLVQILLLNREADKIVIEKVKTALLEWEE